MQHFMCFVLAYGQWPGELAEDISVPVVLAVRESLDYCRAASVTAEDGFCIFVIDLFVNIRQVQEQVLRQHTVEYGDFRYIEVLYMGFHRFHSLSFHLEPDAEALFASQRMRLDDVNPVGIQEMQDIPQLSENDGTVVGPALALPLHIPLVLLYLKVSQLVFCLLVIREPGSKAGCYNDAQC